MFRRTLDVLRQHLRALIAASLVVPTLVAAGTMFVERSPTVTARIWAQGYLYLLDPATSDGQAVTPAAADAQLLRSLLATDAFADRVLAGVQPGINLKDPAVIAAAESELRRNVQVVEEGEHVILLSDRTASSAEGIARLNSLITVFGEAAPAIQVEQALYSRGTSETALRDARNAVQQFDPKATIPPTTGNGATLQRPNPATLLAQANAASDAYRRMLASGMPPEGITAALPALRPASFTVVDRPAVTQTPLLRNLLLAAFALGGVLLAALILAYVAALLDPRIRTGRDVQTQLLLAHLGSTNGGTP